MPRFTPLLAGAALMLCMGPVAAEPARYRLDPMHSAVQFEVQHFGTSTLRGRFSMLQGEASLDPAQAEGLQTAYVGLAIDTATVDTGLPVLDARLRGADLLDSAGHPVAYFVATKFHHASGQLREVHGEFTLRGISQPLALKTLRFSCRRDEQLRTQVCGGDFEAFLLRSSVGATLALPFVGDRVRLLIQVEGIREAVSAAGTP